MHVHILHINIMYCYKQHDVICARVSNATPKQIYELNIASPLFPSLPIYSLSLSEKLCVNTRMWGWQFDKALSCTVECVTTIISERLKLGSPLKQRDRARTHTSTHKFTCKHNACSHNACTHFTYTTSKHTHTQGVNISDFPCQRCGRLP